MAVEMRAARATGPRQIELRTRTRPEPAAGDVVVRVRACGICGSDLHVYSGAFPTPPFCPGHEISGEVAAVGAGGGPLRAGDRVAVEPLLRCQRCWACAVGDYQLCRELRILGTMADGGFADFVRVPAYAVFPLPAGLPFEVGALTEPLAVCVHAMRLADVRAGDRVAVLGAGTIGILSVLAARAAGAADVLVTARHPHQAAAARRLGAAEVFGADPAGVGRLMASAEERPVDVVVETVGGEAETLLDAMRIVRKGGRIGVLGIFTTTVRLDPLLLVLKEPRIVGSLTYGRAGARADFDVALDILRREAAAVATLVTHRFPLEEIAPAFATAADKTTGAVKVTLMP
jgi:2-desacetyl-2-hydroxyethyl bacteriochlorophyllide A dehydrogenase